jgi:hypothetical protein
MREIKKWEQNKRKYDNEERERIRKEKSKTEIKFSIPLMISSHTFQCKI